MTLSDTLKQKRHDANLTQDEVAKKLFVTRQTVSAWESGTNTPSVDLMLRISDLYQLPIDKIIKGDEEVFKTKMKTVVKQNKWYKKGLLAIGGVLILAVALLAFFGLGYEKQVAWIDRLNPTLVKQISYAHMPQHVKGIPNAYKEQGMKPNKWKNFEREYQKANRKLHVIKEVAFGVFPNDDSRRISISNKKGKTELEFNTTDKKLYKNGVNKYIVLYHKGSYIYKAQTISKEQVPIHIRKEIDNASKPYQQQLKAGGKQLADYFAKGIDL